MIAVVDDDMSVRRSLLRLLRSAGFQVAVFDSGESFLAQDKDLLPACLILDIHLAGISGPDLKHELNQRGVDLPTIFITAHDEEATQATLRNFPASLACASPFQAALFWI